MHSEKLCPTQYVLLEISNIASFGAQTCHNKWLISFPDRKIITKDRKMPRGHEMLDGVDALVSALISYHYSLLYFIKRCN